MPSTAASAAHILASAGIRRALSRDAAVREIIDSAAATAEKLAEIRGLYRGRGS